MRPWLRVLVAWLALVTVAVVGIVALGPLGAVFSNGLFPQFLSELPGSIQVREPGYTLVLDPTNGNLSIGTLDRRIYTTVPLAALAGFTSLPAGTHRGFRRSGADLVEELTASDGTPLESVVLATAAHSFTVTFSSRVGPD